MLSMLWPKFTSLLRGDGPGVLHHQNVVLARGGTVGIFVRADGELSVLVNLTTWRRASVDRD